jgi:hypothetical protein
MYPDYANREVSRFLSLGLVVMGRMRLEKPWWSPLSYLFKNTTWNEAHNSKTFKSFLKNKKLQF